MTSLLNFFDVLLFFLWSLLTGTSFMSISWPVLELWQFSFIRNWREIQKLEISPSEFRPISIDWCELETLSLAQMSLTKCYLILQNVNVITFIVSELLRENQQGVKLPPTTSLGLMGILVNLVNQVWTSYKTFS